MSRSIELREVTAENRDELLALSVPAEQAAFVGGTFADAVADAEEYPEANPWLRGVYVSDEAVGFVLLSWNCEPEPPDIIGPWFLWKLMIDQRHQGRGLGSGVVRVVADIVRSEGAIELLTSYVDEQGGPADFYAGLGFVDTGDRDSDGEIIAALPLN